MKWIAVVALIAMCSCKKEEAEQYVSYRATCRMCAIEWHDDGGRMGRDTIIGQIVGQDTLPANGKWNIMAAEGDQLFIQACPLRSDSADGAITVRAGGLTSTAALLECARIDAPFHQ